MMYLLAHELFRVENKIWNHSLFISSQIYFIVAMTMGGQLSIGVPKQIRDTYLTIWLRRPESNLHQFLSVMSFSHYILIGILLQLQSSIFC